MNSDISISIVVPAFNEEKSIKEAVANLIDALDAFELAKYEIIIVDDGSTDQTGEIADRLAIEKDYIRVIHHSKNLGVGSAVRDGYKLAQGEYVSWFPGDGENKAEELVKCFKYFGLYDIINPYITNSQVRRLRRRIVSRVFSFIINLSFGTNLRYTNGLVIYRRKIFDKIKVNSKGFFFQTEALIKALKLGYSYIEVATELRGRKKGISKALNIKSLFEIASSYTRLLADIYLFKRY